MVENKNKTIVTLDLGKYSSSSNTYVVESDHENGNSSFLTHPLVGESVFILASKSDFNKAQAILQSPTEKCLVFSQKHRELLGYKLQAELESLVLYFFVKKVLAPNQKENLAFICAKIGSVLLKNDLQQTVDLVNQNSALLDDFNRVWYINAKPLFEDITKCNNRSKREIVQKIAGFILAQIGDDK